MYCQRVKEKTNKQKKNSLLIVKEMKLIISIENVVFNFIIY